MVVVVEVSWQSEPDELGRGAAEGRAVRLRCGLRAQMRVGGKDGARNTKSSGADCSSGGGHGRGLGLARRLVSSRRRRRGIGGLVEEELSRRWRAADVVSLSLGRARGGVRSGQGSR